MRVGVDYERARMFGQLISKVIGRLRVDDFMDQRYYPPPSASREEVARYFLVMVALDHRLSRPGRPYEGYVDGEFYHGADLLYRIGRKLFEEQPDFFDPKRLSTITSSEFEDLFTAPRGDGSKARPPDPRVRAALLRDLGDKLSRIYSGSAYRIIVESGGMLRKGVGEGFIDRVKVFTAYQDPVEKKPFLLAKFLERRGVLPIYDGYNKEVPVDNHLARIAVRLGIIWVDEELLEKIAGGVEFAPEEDIMLRYAARMAYKTASASGGVDPFIMDDFLWQFGRKCCTREDPVCRSGCREPCRRIGGCDTECVFRSICMAASNPLYMVNEHKFISTWWY